MQTSNIDKQIFNGPSGSGKNWFRFLSPTNEAEPVEIQIYDQIGANWFDDSGVTAKGFTAELAAVPMNRKIVVSINSPGGNVWDGLAIYNSLRRRGDMVTTRVDGVAASIASVIALAGFTVSMPANAMFMIHDPSGMAQGTAADMREMSDRLESHADVLANIYAEHTQKPAVEMRDLMKAETWMNGHEAAALGFVDEVEAEPMKIAACANFNFSSFRHAPAALKQTPPKAKPRTEPMNTKTIIALLKRHSISLPENVTSKQLLALVATLPESETTTATAATEWLEANPTPAAHVVPVSAVVASAPVAVIPAAPVATVADLQAQVAEQRQQIAAANARHITSEFEAIAAANPAVQAQREDFLPRAVADESFLQTLRQLPVPTAGVEPIVTFENRGNPAIETYEAMEAGIGRRNFLISNQSTLLEQYRRHGSDSPQAANTIAAGLLPDHLSNELVIIAHNKLAMLNALSRDFGADPIKPLAVVQVPKATVASTGQQNPTNWESGDGTLAAIAVTVNQESKSFHITNAQLQSGNRLSQLAGINANAFADQINDLVTAIITTGNFGTALTIGVAANFDSADLPPIWAAAKNFPRKSLILDGGHLAYLLPTDKTQFALGEQGAYGFDMIAENNRWTGATANTQGFVTGPDAIGVASGVPVEMPNADREFLSRSTINLKNGLSVVVHVWVSRATRTMWASYDVMFGAAAGDTTQAELLVTI